MDHASAAAFGRFVMQLLAVSAPPDLVRAAALAAADEVRHAELCFALARRFGSGAPRGPAPLAIDGALESVTLCRVIAEGCVGETTAALIAARELEGTSDAAVRDVLEQIAADEARHAELAWRLLAWALSTGGDPARHAAVEAFARALTIAPVSSPPTVGDGDEARVDPATWRAHGRLSRRSLDSVVRTALDEVVAPCAEALLSGSRRRAGGGVARSSVLVDDLLAGSRVDAAGEP